MLKLRSRGLFIYAILLTVGATMVQSSVVVHAGIELNPHGLSALEPGCLEAADRPEA